MYCFNLLRAAPAMLVLMCGMSAAKADVRVTFTKFSVSDCNELGVCDWRLACALGNQTKIEFFKFKEANTNEDIHIDQALTQKEFPPLTVDCEVQEFDSGIGAEWEDVPSTPIIVRSIGEHSINARGDEGDVNILFSVENVASTTQAFELQPARATNLFNADTSGDILWHNSATNELQLWFLQGSSRVGRATLVDENGATAPIGPPWSVVGSRDFDNDNKTDVLWHNSSTGETQIWFMNGHRRAGRATVTDENNLPIPIGPPFSIVGTSNINGDGYPDILWHNANTGETQVWLMKRNQVVSRATVLDERGAPLLVGLPWSIVATSDLGGDGKTAIIWHNAASGEIQYWHLTHHRVSSRSTVLDETGKPIFIGPPFRVTGSDDFNLDGTADILWHNAASGELQIWLMRGTSIARRVTVDALRDGGGALVAAPWRVMSH